MKSRKWNFRGQKFWFSGFIAHALVLSGSKISLDERKSRKPKSIYFQRTIEGSCSFWFKNRTRNGTAWRLICLSANFQQDNPFLHNFVYVYMIQSPLTYLHVRHIFFFFFFVAFLGDFTADSMEQAASDKDCVLGKITREKCRKLCARIGKIITINVLNCI